MMFVEYLLLNIRFDDVDFNWCFFFNDGKIIYLLFLKKGVKRAKLFVIEVAYVRTFKKKCLF